MSSLDNKGKNQTIIDTQVVHVVQKQIHVSTHDMRNRLASLSLSVYLLEKQATIDPAMGKTLDKIKQQVAELNEMMGNLDVLDPREKSHN